MPKLIPNLPTEIAEVAYSANKTLNRKYLLKRILKDLHKAEILFPDDNIEVCNPLDIKYAYIIYDKNYRESTETIHEYLNQHHLYPIGRYGRWKYMSMEDVVLEGKQINSKLYG